MLDKQPLRRHLPQPDHSFYTCFLFLLPLFCCRCRGEGVSTFPFLSCVLWNCLYLNGFFFFGIKVGSLGSEGAGFSCGGGSGGMWTSVFPRLDLKTFQLGMGRPRADPWGTPVQQLTSKHSNRQSPSFYSESKRTGTTSATRGRSAAFPVKFSRRRIPSETLDTIALCPPSQRHKLLLWSTDVTSAEARELGVSSKNNVRLISWPCLLVTSISSWEPIDCQ